MIAKAKKKAARSPFAVWWEKYRKRHGFWNEDTAYWSARAAWDESSKRNKP